MKKIFFLTVMLVMGIIGMVAQTPTNLNVASGNIVISATGASGGGLATPETTLNPNGYVITGTTTTNYDRTTYLATVVVKPGVTTTITLDNCNITNNKGGCINVTGTNTTIILKGINHLVCGSGDNTEKRSSALAKNGMTGTLKIKCEHSDTPGHICNASTCGTLTAEGTQVHAGAIGSEVQATIGSPNEGGFCNLTIEGGIINAWAGAHSPGIGAACGSWQRLDPRTQYCKDIYITGGIVTAKGNDACSGIGSGWGTPVDGIYISGGAKVTAEGGKNSPGIGSGGILGISVAPISGNFDVKNIQITGGETVVTAIGGTVVKNYNTSLTETYTPGIGCGLNNTNIVSVQSIKGTLSNVTAVPEANYQGYIQDGTSATVYDFTAETPFASTQAINVGKFYTCVYFGPYRDENGINSTTHEQIGGNNAVSKTGGAAFTTDQINNLTSPTAKDAGGNDIPVSSLTMDATEFAAINAAKTAGLVGDFPLTYTTPGGTSVTVTVSLRDEGTDGTTFDPLNPTPTIGADNAVSKTGGSAFTDDQLKALTHVNASDSAGMDVPLSQLTPDATQQAAINAAKTAGEVGDYPLTYTYDPGSGGTPVSVTVTVSLRDNGKDGTSFTNGDATIAGNDIISKTGGTGFTSTDLADLMNIAAKDTAGNTVPSANLIANTAQLAAVNAAKTAGKVGAFPVEFCTPLQGTKQACVTDTVFLRDNGEDINGGGFTPGTTEQIGGDNAISKTGGAAFTADQLVTLTQTMAKDKDGNDIDPATLTPNATQMSALNDAKTDGKVGAFPVEFCTPANTCVTDTIFLRENGTDGTTFTPGTDEQIGGDNAVSKTGGSAFTTSQLATLTHNVAKDKDGNSIDPATLIPNAAQFTALNTAKTNGNVGAFPVEFCTPAPGNTCVTDTIFLRDNGEDGTSYTPGDEEIGGDNGISKTGGDGFTGQQLIDLTQTIAKDKDGNTLPLDSMVFNNPADTAALNTAKRNGEVGDFPITICTKSGTCVTDTIFLRDNGTDGTTFNPASPTTRIAANDGISKTGGSAFTPDQIKNLTQPKAKDEDGNDIPLSSLTPDPTQFAAINAAKTASEEGDFPLTYTAPDGTPVTITVYLRDEGTDGTTFTPGTLIIAANDTVQTTGGAAYTIDDIKDITKPVAKDANGSTVVLDDLVPTASELAAINAAKTASQTGDFPLTYTAPDGTTVIVTISLLGGVHYDGNTNDGGAVPVDPNLYNANDPVTVLGNTGTLTKTDACFIGWSFVANAVITTQAGEPSDLMQGGDVITTIVSDTTFYAVWAVDENGPTGVSDSVPDYLQHGVTYDVNGGTGTVPVDNNIYSPTQPVTAKDTLGCNLHNGTNVVFDGWTTTPITTIISAAADTIGKGYLGIGDMFYITSDTTLYAAWADDLNDNGTPDYKETQYDLIYDLNGGTGTAPVDPNSPYIQDMSVAVLDTMPGTSMTNAVFYGWTTSPNPVIYDPTTLADVYMVADMFNTVAANTTFYAVWAEDNNGPDGTPDGIPDFMQIQMIYNQNSAYTPAGLTGTLPPTTMHTKNTTATLSGNIGSLTCDPADQYVLAGWSKTNGWPIVNTPAQKPSDFIKFGETIPVETTDINVYAIWAKDDNGNGIPDYDEPDVYAEPTHKWPTTDPDDPETPEWKPEYDHEGKNNIYCGCDMLLTATFDADPLLERTIKINYYGAIKKGFAIGTDGKPLADTYTVAKGATEFTVHFSISEDSITSANEGLEGTIEAQIVGGGSESVTFTLYGHPQYELLLVKPYIRVDGTVDFGITGGTPNLMRSINGHSWRNAYLPLSASEKLSVTDGVSIKLREPNGCWEEEFFFMTYIDPEIQRYVDIPRIDGVTTTPNAGKHYVAGHQDFSFTAAYRSGSPLKVMAKGYYSGKYIELIGQDLDNGTYKYTLRQVVEPWNITFGPELASEITDNEAINGLSVWTYNSTLYIRSDENATADIYNISGSLCKRINITAGNTTETLPRGIYVVVIGNNRYKVIVK